jgi:hypothetical protein
MLQGVSECSCIYFHIRDDQQHFKKNSPVSSTFSTMILCTLSTLYGLMKWILKAITHSIHNLLLYQYSLTQDTIYTKWLEPSSNRLKHSNDELSKLLKNVCSSCRSYVIWLLFLHDAVLVHQFYQTKRSSPSYSNSEWSMRAVINWLICQINWSYFFNYKSLIYVN